ncbi:MAG: metal-dependent hydrolase, partial [Hyphomicrobiaceae bacterium]
MANFTTHIAVGTIAAGALATITLAADVVGPENLIAVTMAGVLGSILPDIDLKDSRPSRAFFSGLAVFFSFVALFTTAGKYSIAEMILLWLGTLLFVRYVAKWVFHKMSYHRGIWHSGLAAVFCAFATAAAYYWVLKRPEGVSWLAAGFMLIGYFVHLTLDEMYSVDVMDTRIKASFGTALKPIDAKHWGHSAAMALATVAAFMLTPSTQQFTESMSSQNMWSGLQRRALPVDHSVWFGIDLKNLGKQIPSIKRADTAT